MKLNSFKESKSFILDDDSKYYGRLVEIIDFVNPKKTSQGGLKFKFEIINSVPLKNDENETSKGKELTISFWANGKDDDGEWTFPASGKYRNTLDALSSFKGIETDDIEAPEDVYDSVVRFMVENEEKEMKDKSGKEYSATFSNIIDKTIKAVSDDKIEATKTALKKYLASKKEDSSDDISSKKSISKKEAEKSIKKHVEKDEEDEPKKEKSKKKEVEKEDEDEFADEKKTEKTEKSKKKVAEKDESDSDDDDFFGE